MKKLILCMLVVAAAACMTVMGEEANLDVSLTVNPSFTIAWKADTNNDAPGEDISSADMTNDGSGDYSASVWIEGSTNIVNAAGSKAQQTLSMQLISSSPVTSISVPRSTILFTLFRIP